jgi:hypothetical protein
MNKKQSNEKNEKASRKAGKILRQLDEKQLEAVAGGFCRTCGLVMTDGGPILEA